MNADHLIKTAKELDLVSKEVVDEYHIKTDTMVASVNTKMLDRSDIDILIGMNNREMMKDNNANHARFIFSIIYKPNPEVLVNSILWVFNTYQSHGFSINYWPAQLNCWLTVLKEHLTSEGFKQIEPLYNWMQTNIFNFAQLSNEKLPQHNLEL